MNELLGLDHVALTGEGPTLSLSVRARQSVSITGPAGSGKTFLLNVLSGATKCPRGAVRREGLGVRTAIAHDLRRARPKNLVSRPGRKGQASRATDILLATRLWDVRNELVSTLSPSQQAAVELLPILTEEADLRFIDGQLDALDPWTLAGVSRLLEEFRALGAAVVVVTHQPAIIERNDAVLVLSQLQVRFAGTVADLLRIGPPHRLSVRTENAVGVQAMVAPFQVRVESGPDGLVLYAPEGQALAAKLLLEGYGDIESVVLHPPQVVDALLALQVP